MSAWIVDREHIRALVDSAVRVGLIEHDRAPYCLRELVDGMTATAIAEGREPESTATMIGRILWNENVKSIEARYPDTIGNPDRRPGPVGDGPGVGEPFVFVKRIYPLLPGAIGRAVACYEYQTCEHAGWKDSPVREFCAQLVAAALATCPGHESCPWGIESDAAQADARPGEPAPGRYTGPADNTISLMDMIKERRRK